MAEVKFPMKLPFLFHISLKIPSYFFPRFFLTFFFSTKKVPRITSVACWLNSDHPLNFPQSEMLKKSFTTLMSAGLNQAAKLRSMRKKERR